MSEVDAQVVHVTRAHFEVLRRDVRKIRETADTLVQQVLSNRPAGGRLSPMEATLYELLTGQLDVLTLYLGDLEGADAARNVLGRAR